jgi:hypothetical protein
MGPALNAFWTLMPSTVGRRTVAAITSAAELLIMRTTTRVRFGIAASVSAMF